MSADKMVMTRQRGPTRRARRAARRSGIDQTVTQTSLPVDAMQFADPAQDLLSEGQLLRPGVRQDLPDVVGGTLRDDLVVARGPQSDAIRRLGAFEHVPADVGEPMAFATETWFRSPLTAPGAASAAQMAAAVDASIARAAQAELVYSRADLDLDAVDASLAQATGAQLAAGDAAFADFTDQRLARAGEIASRNVMAVEIPETDTIRDADQTMAAMLAYAQQLHVGFA